MDTIADSLIRIKNSYRAFRGEVRLTYSKPVLAICNVLEKEGYIERVEEVEHSQNPILKEIRVALKYKTELGSSVNKRAALSEVKRISKPGLRIYKGKGALPYVLNGLGIAIVSTPKGIMTDRQARKEGVGGEIMAYVW